MLPFDAVLLISFGGPQKPDDIRPFLANVLRGRRIPPERVEEVAHHYELFGGVSPITELTLRQAKGLSERLHDGGLDLPVYVGMRNWHPLLEDTLRAMSHAGVRRAIGLIAAAHRSYSGCLQYKLNVIQAQATLAASGVRPPAFTYVGDWHTHDGFIAANADHVGAAWNRLPADLRSQARLLFTAHSIPHEMARQYPYEAQIHESARLVAERLGVQDWTIVFQSRSGRPEDPWIGPDICDYLRDARKHGLRAVVVSPIGFVCDHIEVLYDLDREAATLSQELGIAMVRAESANDHPAFLETLADVVRGTCRRYEGTWPLSVAHSSYDRLEPPPPRR